MGKIIIIGGGWAGCAAAVRARRQGHAVHLLERTDLLLGLGNVGGIMRNNGRYTAAEENIALGAGELFEITDRLSTHKDVDFPGHRHASFYDVALVEPEVRRLLLELGVHLHMMTRAVDIEPVQPCENGRVRLQAVLALTAEAGHAYRSERFTGDVFVETTGSTGPMGNCMQYGNGCAMCILRCPAFGPRVSLTEKAGLWDVSGERPDGMPGAFSGSCKLEKRTLSPKLQKKLEKNGFAIVSLPKKLIHREKLEQKVCQQYALDSFAENLILIDTGSAKLMTSYFNLEELRSVEGFENVRFADPYAGGRGNSVRYIAVGRTDLSLRACGAENLFLGGEKSGFFVGHTEAITTGSLAGYNAGCFADGRPLLQLPGTLATGDLIRYADELRRGPRGLSVRLTFAGGVYFERMKHRQLYTVDRRAIRRRVEEEGLTGVYTAAEL